jgi:hypothetical protein
MEVSGVVHVLVALPPEKEPRVPIELGDRWVPESVWILWNKGKSIDPAGKPTPYVLTVARHYTDWTIVTSAIHSCPLKTEGLLYVPPAFVTLAFPVILV